MEQAKSRIGQYPDFHLFAREGFVEGAVSRYRSGGRFLRLARAPTPAERCLSRRRSDEILRVKVGVADDAHRPGDFSDGLPSYFEQAGTEIASDTVIGNSPFQALSQHRLVEPVSSARMT